ncbi:acetoacetate--CoA ligase [Microbacterium sp. LMI12-1-1.1]|uniref:acetoacetate--CoA ligase n=1 Tax=Microbacterium sp. LMI12-1-1.1 TaxID=3135225 RepID=UPI003449B78F
MIVDGASNPGDVAWMPNNGWASNMTRFAERLVRQGLIDKSDYESLWAWSVEEPSAFWTEFADFADVRLDGEAGPVTVGDEMPGVSWFPGRRVNFAEHLLRQGDGVAVITIDEHGDRTEHDWTQLRADVGALGGALRQWGIVSGDRVAAVLSNTYEALVGLLAVASVGAVWSICSPEFGSGAIISRFAQLEPRVLLTASCYQLGGRTRDRSREIAEVIDALPTLDKVVWVDSLGSSRPETEVPTVLWADALSTDSPRAPQFEPVDFSHPLWVLFSSGTTGVPKGIVHGHGGVLLEILKMLLLHSELKTGDRYLSIASTSWVVWNTLASAIAVGAVPVLVDGSPTYPTPDRIWRIVSQESVAAIGVSAGYIHSCRKDGLDLRGTVPSLRTVQVTGSPLSVDGYRWILDRVGDVWISSMSGGTDIASVFVAGSPSLPVRLGRIPARALAVDAQAWNERGESIVGEPGELVVTSPMPSMPLFFWGDSSGQRYQEAYFEKYPGRWCHGDIIDFDSDGSSVIHGRSDSTLNRNGLRMGPADIYQVVENLPEVVEALVVGAELGTEDYFMPLFLHITDGFDVATVQEAVRAAIRQELSGRYLPDDIVTMRRIPHTRTGKKLEVPVKRLLQGAALSDVVSAGAVDDFAVLQDYAAYAAQVRASKPGAS